MARILIVDDNADEALVLQRLLAAARHEVATTSTGREALLHRVGVALSRTSRQVNTLERRLDPSLRAQLTDVRRTLDEREREEHLRLARLLRHRA